MRLRDVVGQDHAVAALRRAAAAGRLPHAYLFDGPPSVGKRSTAVALAAALGCTEEPGEGCGDCETCRRIAAGIHPDVRTVEPETTQITKPQVDEVVALAQSRPHEAAARVMILRGADLMNDSAANCLLKTLEEPAPGNHIVLITTGAARLPSTIRSRTQRLRFPALGAPALMEIARRRGVDRAHAEVAAALADGSAARLLELAGEEGDGAAAWQTALGLLDAAAGERATDVFAASAAAAEQGERVGLLHTVSLLARLYRDALATAAGAPELVLLEERRTDIARLVGPDPATRVAPLRRALGAIQDTTAALHGNANLTLALDRMLLELRRAGVGARAAVVP